MIEQIIFTPEAEQDVADAFAWYTKIESGLGEDFLHRIDSCLQTIQEHPEIYPVAKPPFRRALIRRFPFEIFYEASSEAIVIFAVFHCSQNPQKWQKRLRS